MASIAIKANSTQGIYNISIKDSSNVERFLGQNPVTLAGVDFLATYQPIRNGQRNTYTLKATNIANNKVITATFEDICQTSSVAGLSIIPSATISENQLIDADVLSELSFDIQNISSNTFHNIKVAIQLPSGVNFAGFTGQTQGLIFSLTESAIYIDTVNENSTKHISFNLSFISANDYSLPATIVNTLEGIPSGSNLTGNLLATIYKIDDNGVIFGSDINAYMTLELNPQNVLSGVNTSYNAVVHIENIGSQNIEEGYALEIDTQGLSFSYTGTYQNATLGSISTIILPAINVGATLSIPFVLLGTLTQNTKVNAIIVDTIHTTAANIFVSNTAIEILPLGFNIDVSDTDITENDSRLIQVAIAVSNTTANNWAGNKTIEIELPNDLDYEGATGTGLDFSYNPTTRKVTRPLQSISVGEMVIWRFFITSRSTKDFTITARVIGTNLISNITIGVFDTAINPPIRDLAGQGISMIFGNIVYNSNPQMTYISVEIQTPTPFQQFEKLKIHAPSSVVNIAMMGSGFTHPKGKLVLEDIIPSLHPTDNGYYHYFTIYIATAIFNTTNVNDWWAEIVGTNVTAQLVIGQTPGQ